MKKGLTIAMIVIVVVAIGFFIWAFGFSSKDSLEDEKVEETNSKPEPALTGGKDKEDEEKEESKDESKDKKNEDKKKNEKVDKDKEIKQLKENATYVVESLNKSQDEIDKSTTQTNLKEAATEELMEKYFSGNNSSSDKLISEVKNVRFEIEDEKDLDSSEIEGTLTYDLIKKPKDKDDKEVKPSTDIDTKTKLWFKKEDGKFKVDKFKV